MKLPDFSSDPSLDNLRRAMGASLRDYTPARSVETITAEEIERLQTDGIEIPLEEVQVLNTGAFVYKGRRVIVYIRDVAQYNDEYGMPKFHLAMCRTLANMLGRGRFQTRYVVATRDDGKFKIHKIKNADIIKSEEALDICQNCLSELNYHGFHSQMSRSDRRTRVQDFSLRSYLEEFGRTCVWATPRYDDVTAPPNVYSIHFHRISDGIKQQRGYRCEETACRQDLSKTEDHKFLHAHHVDADKSNNHSTNIKLLCIRCHAQTFQHSHLKANPDYNRYCEKFSLAK